MGFNFYFKIDQLCAAQRSPCKAKAGLVAPLERLRKIRSEMVKIAPGRPAAIEAFIVTNDDEHQGEYVADRDKRLEYVSGFRGRIAQAVITRTKNVLWVENQDFWLADTQLDCNWTIFRLGDGQDPQITEWLRKELRTGVRVGADPKLIPANTWEEWRRDLEVNHIALVELASNIVDEIWIDRPPYASEQAFFIDGGESRDRKLEMLRTNLTRYECGAMVVTALEEIAWLLNVRGGEGPYIPFLRSYLIVTRTDAFWYLPKDQKTTDIFLELDKTNISRIRTQVYENIWKDLRISGPNWGNILVPSRCEFSPGASQAVASAIPPSRRVMRQSPVIFLKAQKNEKEISGMREAGLQDSVDFIEFIAKIEQEIKYENVTEYGLTQLLEAYQRESQNYKGPAAPLRVSYGRNSVKTNYLADFNNSAVITFSDTLVISSSNHYLLGTTAQTRTMHFGNPSLTEIQTYTRTVGSLVEFGSRITPADLRTSELDVLGRVSLWRKGYDFKHPIGHGIGCFSSLRESPININRNPLSQMHYLRRGYFVTAGPSQYRQNEFGIELQNTFEITANESNFLQFRPVTLIPFEPKLIEPRDLTPEQVRYINDYHFHVQQTVGAELKKQKKMTGFYWLMKKTKSITPYCSLAHELVGNVGAIMGMFMVRYVL